MASVGAFDRTEHLAELNKALRTGSGILSPAARKAAVWANLGGDAVVAAAIVDALDDDLSAITVTAAGGSTARTLADWFAGLEKGVTSVSQFEWADVGEPEFEFSLLGNATVRLAKWVERSEHPGDHIGTGWATHHIDVEAVGSGENLPASADKALTISLRKKDWETSSVPGELDGVYVGLRQGGPDAGASGGTRSSAGAYVADVQNVGQVGFATIMEANVSNLARTTLVETAAIHIYAGVIDINTAAQTGYGFIADVNKGSLDVAFLARQPASGNGTWDYLFQGTKDGAITFSVTPEGIARITGQLNIANAATPATIRNLFIGTGTPEAAVTASIGSLYMRDNASAGLCVWAKYTGSGNTGWIALLERHFGTSAGRPALSGVGFRGFIYFDTDLNKPIWWDGDEWVDSAGADLL